MASTTNFGYNIGEVLKEYLDDPIFILNKDYEFEYVTDNFHLQNLGLRGLEGKITDILHPEDSQRSMDFPGLWKLFRPRVYHGLSMWSKPHRSRDSNCPAL